jgi:hypothetical protein
MKINIVLELRGAVPDDHPRATNSTLIRTMADYNPGLRQLLSVVFFEKKERQ